MTLNQFGNNLTHALRSWLAREFRVVFTIAVILFTANLAYSAYQVGFTNGQTFESARNYTISGDTTFMVRLRVATSLGLLVCVAGLAFRKLHGVVASMLGVVWIVLIYGWWKYKSVQFLRNLEIPDYSAVEGVSHAAGLRGASWWDLVLLVIAALIFIWEALVIVRVLRSSNGI